MPRWLVAFVLSIVLSCYGFAALAQNLGSVSHHHGGNTQSQQLDGKSAPCDALAVDTAGNTGDSDDRATPHGDAGTDHSEAIDVGFRATGPLLLWAPRPEAGGTSVLTPFLERPKRPPRGIAFSA